MPEAKNPKALMSVMGGKRTLHRPCSGPMDMPRNLLAVALILSLASCSAGACQLPKEWKLVSDLKPPTVAYTPKDVIHAIETAPGRWSWRGSTVTHQNLLTELRMLREFNPQPLLMFSFADGHSCEELDRLRAGITEATRCSAEDVPCLEGTPAQLR